MIILTTLEKIKETRHNFSRECDSVIKDEKLWRIKSQTTKFQYNLWRLT